jgi:hypothetical protein
MRGLGHPAPISAFTGLIEVAGWRTQDCVMGKNQSRLRRWTAVTL